MEIPVFSKRLKSVIGGKNSSTYGTIKECQKFISEHTVDFLKNKLDFSAFMSVLF